MQIESPPVAPGARLPETAPLMEAGAEQELLDGFLAKLQAILRGDEPLRPAAGDDPASRRERPRA
ncbi:MAG TPA: hypothetical protein VIA45_07870 [Thermoanaerobaculia bacterium]